MREANFQTRRESEPYRREAEAFDNLGASGTERHDELLSLAKQVRDDGWDLEMMLLAVLLAGGTEYETLGILHELTPLSRIAAQHVLESSSFFDDEE